MEDAQHFVAGNWTSPSSGESIDVIDPSDGQVFSRIARGNTADIDSAVRAARAICPRNQYLETVESVLKGARSSRPLTSPC